MDESFPKRFRIRKRHEFRRVYEKGRRISARFVIIHHLDSGLDYPRIGITVTKKVGNAAVRNRWKRLIREVFRKNRPAFPPKDMVITVKKGVNPPSYRELEEDIVGAVARIDNRNGR